MTTPHQMASMLAVLLTESDRRELEEVVRRWLEEAEGEEQRAVMRRMGDQILALRTALEAEARPLSRAEVEETLRVMLTVAAAGNRPHEPR